MGRESVESKIEGKEECEAITVSCMLASYCWLIHLEPHKKKTLCKDTSLPIVLSHPLSPLSLSFILRHLFAVFLYLSSFHRHLFATLSAFTLDTMWLLKCEFRSTKGNFLHWRCALHSGRYSHNPKPFRYATTEFQNKHDSDSESILAALCLMQRPMTGADETRAQTREKY